MITTKYIIHTCTRSANSQHPSAFGSKSNKIIISGGYPCTASVNIIFC